MRKNITDKALAQIDAPGNGLKTPRLGNNALTQNLWWCECGRGLGENIQQFDIHERWKYCPRCGALINWEAVGLGSEC